MEIAELEEKVLERIRQTKEGETIEHLAEVLEVSSNELWTAIHNLEKKRLIRSGELFGRDVPPHSKRAG